jgi:protein-S-isoprenylcysteine O-methyltransferase Ste14
MNVVHHYLFWLLWGAWAAYWWLLSARVKGSVRRESLASRLTHILPLVVAASLLAGPNARWHPLDAQILPRTEATFWAGAVLTVAGLLFAIRARHYIGANWSASVTIKESHELVTGGPYALVRHPIYTGLLLAFAGTAVAIGQWRGVVAVVIALVAIVHKLRIEERWMLEQFGDGYRAYQARVPRLVPFVHRLPRRTT